LRKLPGARRARTIVGFVDIEGAAVVGSAPRPMIVRLSFRMTARHEVLVRAWHRPQKEYASLAQGHLGISGWRAVTVLAAAVLRSDRIKSDT
jgi:hypothetical protein